LNGITFAFVFLVGGLAEDETSSMSLENTNCPQGFNEFPFQSFGLIFMNFVTFIRFENLGRPKALM
jgi:hypothetical protein